MDDLEQKSRRNKWLSLISIPIQMGIVIFGFAWFGGWLDEKHPSDTLVYKAIFALAGVAISLYLVITQVKNIDKS